MKPFIITIIFSAVSIALIAAIFSVTGLSSLFSGHFIQVAIMAGSLEFGKLVAVSFLYRYWNVISRTLKTYLLMATFILMLITSAGIFGYLSESFQKTQAVYTNVDLQAEVWNSKSQSYEARLSELNNQLNKLIEIRTSQSERLDSLYNRRAYTSAKRTEEYIATTDIKISELNDKVFGMQDSIFKYKNQVVIASSQKQSGDLGPLIYIAETFNVEIGTIVKWVILLLIFVFDPLAISLIIAANIALVTPPKNLNKEWWEHKNHKEEPVVKEEPIKAEIIEEPEVKEKIIKTEIIEEPVFEKELNEIVDSENINNEIIEEQIENVDEVKDEIIEEPKEQIVSTEIIEEPKEEVKSEPIKPKLNNTFNWKGMNLK